MSVALPIGVRLFINPIDTTIGNAAPHDSARFQTPVVNLARIAHALNRSILHSSVVAHEQHGEGADLWQIKKHLIVGVGSRLPP
jgi:hypothetical protein